MFRLMELDHHSIKLLEEYPLLRKDLPTRKYTCSEINVLIYRSALKEKSATKWTEGNLDKWLKSPPDYAPGISHLLY
jgi:hypothetical protein